MPVGHDPDFPLFARVCDELGVSLTIEIYQTLRRYAQLIQDWNQKVNLISRKDTHRIFTYHIVDSLAVNRFLPAGSHCADLGSGAGLPGIPLAIARPDLSMVLIESVKKKSRFLELALAELGLKNARVLCERAEALAPLQCDIILSRLTSPIEKTLNYGAPHLKLGGTMILYKTANRGIELEKNQKILARTRLRLLKVESIQLPFSNIERSFLFFTRY
ncbi:MAG: 16S rRNA (guanine(527)-N(7))-methyltransferase RsmG [bacterium]